MDPLSIIASGLTLLTAVAAVAEKTASLKSADKALQTVLEDLSDFRMLVQQVNILVDQYQAEIPEQQRSDLALLLERAKGRLGDLNDALQGATQDGGKGIMRAKKLQWTRRASHIAKLQEELKDLKPTLSTLLNSISTSCSLRLQAAVREVSQHTSNSQNTRVLFEDQAMQKLARQEDAMDRMLSSFKLLELSILPRTNPRRLESGYNALAGQSCSRCTLVRSKGISQACLSCSKIAIGMRYKKQPDFRVNFLDKKLLLPGDHLGRRSYAYLDTMVSSWYADTVTIFIKVSRAHESPNLELRVREFRPSEQFQPYISSRVFIDMIGLLPPRTVRTRPYAIPYTHYVECGRLEMWARASLRWKLEQNKDRPGRTLLSTLSLQGQEVFANHKFINAAFTFAALTLVWTSHIFATGNTAESAVERHKSASPSSKPLNHHNSQRHNRPHSGESPKRSTASRYLNFADDHYDGISTCPAAISCQLSLLCLERAREIEHDLLADLQTLIFGQNHSVSETERLFIAYISLALMMDAYEKYLTAFEGVEEQFQRCLHLVESLTSELGHLLRGATMVYFLQTVSGEDVEGTALAKLGSEMRMKLLDDDNREFFARHSWAASQSRDFRDNGFIFQCLLHGFG